MKPIHHRFLIIITLLSPTQWAIADDDEWEHHNNSLKGPTALLYRNECGSCHIAYPPRFLSTSAWQKIMGGLEDHFGENAELDPSGQQKITRFLSDHAGRSRWYRFWEQKSDEEMPRITKTRPFLHEHHEIPSRFIRNNDQIRSLSQCDACHINAATGSFNEHQIRIPGIGRWEDD